MAGFRLKHMVVALLLQGVALPALADGLTGAYLAARQARYMNDYAEAAQYYTRALVRDPGNPELMESAALVMLTLGDIDRALPIARKMRADGLDSQIAEIILVADAGGRDDWDALLTRGSDTEGVGPLVDQLMRAWAQIGKGAMSEGLKAFDQISESPDLKNFAQYHKALALASVGDFEGAEAIYAAESTGSLQLTRRGMIARLQVLSQLGRNDDAVAVLDSGFGADLDPGLRVIRDRLLAGETLAFTQVRGARDGLAEVFFSVAAALSSDAEAQYTLLYARAAEYLRPDHVDALLLSAELLESLGRHDLAVLAYKKVPQDSYAFHVAELGRAEALRREGRGDAAIEVLEKLSQSHGEIPIVQVTMGDFLRDLDRHAEAVKAYDRAIALIPEEGADHWFIYYARATSESKLDRWKEAEADFRTALRLSPEQPQVLNYLGYSLVEKRIKLDEALEMIERAVAAQPDSGYIVDSLGWALYRLGKYEEAAVQMERAAALLPTDPVVNDHLGDALWAVGRKIEAEFQWRRALSFVGQGDTDEESDPERIRRKLEVGLDQLLAEEGASPLKQPVHGSN